MIFDLQRVPFSRFGSYLSISDLREFRAPVRKNGIYLRTMYGGGRNAFRLDLLHDGKLVSFTTTATPTLLTLSSSFGDVQIAFAGTKSLRIYGKGVSLRCIAEDGWTVPYPGGSYEVNTDVMKYMFLPVHGQVDVGSSGNSHGKRKLAIVSGPASGDSFEIEIDAYRTGWIRHPIEKSFDEVKQDAREAYDSWLQKMPSVPTYLGSGAELAAYVSWESVVEPSGNLKRPAMLMSKNWMTSVWSWDHAFNAMAMSGSDASLAWDQYMLPFDLQAKTGDLPDRWSADSISWQQSKPPVHGWVLKWLMRQGYVKNRQQLREIYGPLSKWTEWSFDYRNPNGDGYPEYRDGDEAGWDNSTVFAHGGPVESPDLCAYLVLQMETLADVAMQLGKPQEAQAWRERSNRLLHNTITHFWNGHAFVAYRAKDGKQIDSESLLLVMPIVLGHRLPPPIRAALVADIKHRMAQSSYGLPSEPTDSPYYTRDGYWRGPIWAPTTMIIADGLDDMGEHALANQLREKFCSMAQKGGMAENFDASSGGGLRDPAYTWTSSVFLIFAHELLH